MFRLLGFTLVCTSAVLSAPLALEGHGQILGTDGFFDLTGTDFHWHISTDSTAFMGQTCDIGAPCDLGLFFTADSSSDVTSVSGLWDGVDWGAAPRNVRTASNTSASWIFSARTIQGERIAIPLAIFGRITGSGLDVVFAGAGTQWITVLAVDSGMAEVIFGSFDFSGTIAADSDPVPEPGAFGLGVAGFIALVALRRAARAVT